MDGDGETAGTAPAGSSKCANPNCRFLAHSFLDFSGYCCNSCKTIRDAGRKKISHDERCEQLLSASAGDAAVAGRSGPWSSSAANSFSEAGGRVKFDAVQGDNARGVMPRQVWCGDIRYTQNACSAAFTDGRSFQDLIDAVVADPTYPLQHQSLVLDVVRVGNSLFSIDNRRLFCFNEAQQRVHPERVLVQVRQHLSGPLFTEFSDRYSTKNGGVRIRVRNSQV
mmetsp:Transcript_138263/g.253657  ORF Transcript_138263/g.253657 Transcript_138263/m.253657 type:complete len:224 (+) Transcript_138263:88-759(+)